MKFLSEMAQFNVLLEKEHSNTVNPHHEKTRDQLVECL